MGTTSAAKTTSKKKTTTTTGGGYWSPELTGLKNAYLTKDWMNEPGYVGAMQKGVTDLLTPQTQILGRTEQERNNIYNLAKTQQAGGNQAAMNSALEALGRSGLRDSGFADTAVANIARAGESQMGQTAAQIAQDEVNRRAQEGLDLANLNTTRAGVAGNLGAQAGGIIQGQTNTGIAAGNLGLSIENARKLNTLSEEEFQAQMGLSKAQFLEQQQQNQFGNAFNMAQLGEQQNEFQQGHYWDLVSKGLGL